MGKITSANTILNTPDQNTREKFEEHKVSVNTLHDSLASEVANRQSAISQETTDRQNAISSVQSQVVNSQSEGAWNASTNTPTLSATPLAIGKFYEVSVAGTSSIPTGGSIAYNVGDKLISNGTVWQHIPFIAFTRAISSVDSRTKEIFSDPYPHYLLADPNGYVLYKVDESGNEDSLRVADIDNRLEILETPPVGGESEVSSISMPNYLIVDEDGFCVYAIINGDILQNNDPIIADILKDGFANRNKISDFVSPEYSVSSYQSGVHKAFPTIASGLTDTIHICYRKGASHVDKTGAINYCYSTDYGLTFTEVGTVIPGGLGNGTTVIYPEYRDQRDMQLYRMSNGKFLFFNNWLSFGVDGLSIGVSQMVAYILNEVNGVLDWANQVKVIMPYPAGMNDIAIGHGIAEKDDVLYVTAYGADLKVYIYKSSDFGLTWTATNTNIDGTENAPVFVGSRLYLIVRNINSNADTGAPGDGRTSPLYYSRVYYSDDFGLTFSAGKQINVFTHGMSASSLGESFMITGRTILGTTLSVYKHHRQQMEHLVVNEYNGEWDADYADHTRCENYYYVVYYTCRQLKFEIKVKKIAVEKLINL